jgi:radical SAM protein with 4Fe4S-binding SPASM domain
VRTSKRLDYLMHTIPLTYNILMRGRYVFNYDLMSLHSSRMPFSKRINLLKAGGNLIHRNLQPWSWPIHMQIELTSYCNLRCKICPIGSGTLRRKPESIDPALFERLMNEAGPYLLTLSLWGWGEPLLHPRLADILRLTQNRGIITFLSTNGQNLDDPRVLKALIEYPPTYLIVAIDGLTDETNSKYRVGAKIAPILAGVKKLAQMKKEREQHFPILHHRYIVMKHNEHEMPQIKQFGIENHFNMCTVRTLSIIDAQDEIYHQQLVPDDRKLQAYEYQNDARVNRNDFLCEKAFIFAFVFADGTVVDCDQDFNANHPYGNLSDGRSFADIWWGKRAAKVRRIIRDDMDNFSHCQNCPFKDRPVTDCSIMDIDLHH